jgi:hypothetical protein
MLPVPMVKPAASAAEPAADRTNVLCRITGCLRATPVFAGLCWVPARQIFMKLGKLV